ncbi:sulfatase family protein [Aspergillus mulundensis]|uniref:Arylsulfatase n=1 Tax=Aspergillus mulundensis TaxID=1810919 RepID=A0A3D8R3S2_9EURO|nr:Arylsulfatase [Aspergillus mulundensis]RDW68702.1 Arylsulfatase [Aspergillus mulundensis]
MKFSSTVVWLSSAIAVNAIFPFDLQQVLSPAPLTGKPNFVFIITDDQDLKLDSIDYMPLLSKHIKQKGTFFSNHFVTTALCCPSRVSLWTGRQAHNTNVTDVSPPYGGYPKFVDRGFNENFLPVWLQSAGYDTYYTGKLLNAHTVDNYHSPYVNGFTGSDFLLDPFTYSYLNSTYQRNRDEPVSYEGRHTVEVITEKALGFLEDGLNGDRPFFLTVAPVAPHSNVDVSALGKGHSPTVMTEPIPLDRHKDLFSDVKVPRTSHFNPDEPSGASWIKTLPQQNKSTIEYHDHFYRQRLRALQGVDELVDSIVTRLEGSGQLDNTYIIYTSDNGYHIGQHRLPPGKACGFEEDIRVPLFIRGPGVPEDEVETAVTTHIDLAPTIFGLAEIPLREDFDGTPIPLPSSVGSNAVSIRHEHVTVEYWGNSYLEGERGALSNPANLPFFNNNTYKSVRIIGEGYNLYYSVWCSNEHELYDLITDPYQLNNLFTSKEQASEIFGYPLLQVISRLDSILLVLKSCKGATCIKPWDVLHPGGSVQNLKDALNPLYDAFYTSQARVSFDHCEHGYIPEVEGPQDALPFTRYGLNWDVWT